MTTVCIQCALRAIVEDKPPPTFDESPEEHAAKYHSDPRKTREERDWLERKLQEKAKTL